MKRLRNIPILPILALLPAFVLTLRSGASLLTPLLALAVLPLLWHLQNRRKDVPVDTDRLANEMLSDPFAMMTQMRTGQSVGHLPSRHGRLVLRRFPPRSSWWALTLSPSLWDSVSRR